MMALSCAIVLLIGAVLLGLRVVRDRSAASVFTTVSVVEVLLAFTVAAWRDPGAAPSYHLGRYFVVDASSTLFLVLTSVIYFGITIYALHRSHTRSLTGGTTNSSVNTFFVRTMVFFAACVLAILSNHLVSMWVFLEISTLAIAPLIYFGRGELAQRASWKYVMFSVVGLGFNFAGLMCIARAMGGVHGEQGITLFIDGLRQITPTGDVVWWRLGLSLMVFGLGTKLGLAPMYSWCPDAYDEAPPSVTALLAAVQFNVVALALFREVGLLRSFDPTLVSDELIVMGIMSLIVAVLHIIRVDNYKRLIAYASINHAGAIALGLAAATNANAAYGVVLYVVSNAFVKAVLFMTCGNIKTQFGTKQISVLRGIIRTMPFSGWVFMLGVFALLGFAPFGSFLGEVIMLSNMTDGSYLFVFFFVCVVLTLLLLLCGRLLFPMIWGDAIDDGVRHRDPISSNIASIFYVAILISLGIYSPAPISSLLYEVAKSLAGQ